MPEETIKLALRAVLKSMSAPDVEVRLERPKDPDHGDWATNLALTLASALRRNPREIAQELADRLDLDAAGVEKVEVAGPGFLNFHLTSGTLARVLPGILAADSEFGRQRSVDGPPIMVEFVSANPTGPLHLGHGRQAALGDAIASLLEWTGWSVHREYYYNDAGNQIDLLSRSVKARYQTLLGRDTDLPEGGYQGTYVVDVARALAKEVGEAYLDQDDSAALDSIRDFAVAALRAEQDRDLNDFRVHFDEYFLESSLYTDGLVDQTIEALEATGLVYRKDEAVWLRTTEFGDQKDRVMVKRDGSPTYFLPDVAYHMTKWNRGFRHVINVQGADHHGTVTRVRAGLQALGLPEGYPEYVLHQMVTVEKDGQEVKFSKRAGGYTTMRELYSEVGVDVARYFFLMRKPEAHLVFDLNMALDQSDSNPVYKTQYAHARMCSIFRKAGIDAETLEAEERVLSLLSHPLERDLVKRLGDFPDAVQRAAAARAPHILCDVLEQIAGSVNSWYHAGNPTRNPDLAVLVDDRDMRAARLALARGVQVVLRNGLGILGVSAPTRMEREEETEDA